MGYDDDPPSVTDKLPVPLPDPNRKPPPTPRTRLELCWGEFEKRQEDRDRRSANEQGLLLAQILERLDRAAPTARPSAAPPSGRQKVAAAALGGALKGIKWAAYASLGLGVLVQAARLWRPELVGPLESLQQLFGGAQ